MLLHSRSLRQAGDETSRIGPGGLVVLMLVQADQRTIGRELLDERRFTALPRSEQTDHRRVGRSLPDYGFQRPGKLRTVTSICRIL